MFNPEEDARSAQEQIGCARLPNKTIEPPAECSIEARFQLAEGALDMFPGVDALISLRQLLYQTR